MNQCCANRWLGQSLAVDVSGCLKPRRCHRQLRRSIWAASKQSCDIIDAESVRSHALPIKRRSCVAMIASVAAAALQLSAPVATTAKTPANVPFVKLPSGLRVQDIVAGNGDVPQAGDTVVINWSGYTSGYQGKRIDNTSTRDEPFTFRLGKDEVIPAFDEAVAGMKAGGIRRVEIDGRIPELGWPRDRNRRYIQGPKPHDFDGQRSLDFVLDNDTLQDFNRTMLIDIKLLNIRRV